jgi:Ice-binding-like
MALEAVLSNQVSIGSCSKFAVLAGSVADFENALTVVKTGSVGNYPGTSITGNYRLIGGTLESATPAAHACANDMYSSAKNASLLPCTYTLPNSLLSGTLFSGVYCSSPGTFSIALQTTIYLDARNVSSAVFMFRAATTVIAGYYSSIILINKAQAANVYWYVGSSATIG